MAASGFELEAPALTCPLHESLALAPPRENAQPSLPGRQPAKLRPLPGLSLGFLPPTCRESRVKVVAALRRFRLRLLHRLPSEISFDVLFQFQSLPCRGPYPTALIISEFLPLPPGGKLPIWSSIIAISVSAGSVSLAQGPPAA